MYGPIQNSVKRLYNAFFYSMQGVRACMKSEQAFRQEIYLSVILVPLGLWLGGTISEKVLLVASVFFVLIVELLNSAIERVVDRISYDRHELSKEAKDMASAAVMFSVLICVVTWTLILLF